MNRVLNHKKDSYDPRDRVFPPIRISNQASMVSMLNDLGPQRDQKMAGSCTGQASGGFFDSLYKQQTKYFNIAIKADDMFSALFIYAEERIMDGTFPEDAGSESRTAMRILSKYGACLDSQMPYSDQLIKERPTTTAVQMAALAKIGAYHRVLYDDGCVSFRGCLASGYCRIIGIPVYQGIYSDEMNATGVLPIPASGDTPIGGHELLVYGYNDEEQVELVRNSWGSSWGLNGNLKIPYKYYEAVGGNETMDSWTAHMGKPWIAKK